MNKTGTDSQLEYLLKIKELKNKIFFLSVSLFPGETLQSVATTGRFLKKYGPTVDLLTSRVKANSSYGGLGQFFQHYDGCIGRDKLKKLGKIYEVNFPTRLEPSFAPFSLLNQKIIQIKKVEKKEQFWWTDVYNLNFQELSNTIIDGKKTINSIIGEDTNKLKHILLLIRLGKIIQK